MFNHNAHDILEETGVKDSSSQNIVQCLCGKEEKPAVHSPDLERLVKLTDFYKGELLCSCVYLNPDVIEESSCHGVWERETKNRQRKCGERYD